MERHGDRQCSNSLAKSPIGRPIRGQTPVAASIMALADQLHERHKIEVTMRAMLTAAVFLVAFSATAAAQEPPPPPDQPTPPSTPTVVYVPYAVPYVVYVPVVVARPGLHRSFDRGPIVPPPPSQGVFVAAPATGIFAANQATGIFATPPPAARR